MKRQTMWRVGLVSGIIGLALLWWRRRYLGEHGDQALRGYYNLMAPLYDRVAEAPYRAARREAVRQLGLKPGDQVLDVACGTGVNFALLQAAVGDAGTSAGLSTGLVIGVDYSEGMLDQARHKITAHGWDNVTLHQEDAAELSPAWLAEHVPAAADGVDAVLITLGLSVIPDWQAALRGAAAVLRPGGRLVVMDGKEFEGWKRLFQPALWLVEPLAGADTRRRPWMWMAEHLEDVKVDDNLLFGTVYIASGRRPASDRTTPAPKVSGSKVSF